MKAPTNYFFYGQFQHILLLVGLFLGTVFLAQSALDDSTWLGITDSTWFYTLLAVVIIHQILGWFVFRSQLCFSLFSRVFGRYDLLVWGILFFPFLLLRPLLTLALGLADAGSLTEFRSLQIILGLILLLPVFYTLWSLHKYFGMTRALGADHFREEYRQMPIVREGAFKYSSNAMYAFVFLLFWAIALLTGSLATLAVALFQHAYIWVHLYCTEEPDMRIIYGNE